MQKIKFNYGDIENQTVNLKINIQNFKDINSEVTTALSLYKNGKSNIKQAIYWNNEW